MPPSKLLPKEEIASESKSNGNQSHKKELETELRPVIVFGSSTTIRTPQLSATDHPGSKLEDTTPYTFGMIETDEDHFTDKKRILL